MKKILLLVVLASTFAWTQPDGKGEGKMDQMPFKGPIIEKLNLSTDQLKQFDKLQTEMQKNQIALRSKIQTLRLDARDLFREDVPDRVKTESKLSEISKLQNEMKLNRVGFWFDVNKILTSEQQKIWKDHHAMKSPIMHPHQPGGMMGRGIGMRGEKHHWGKMRGDYPRCMCR